jgi:hypothetical protein
MSGTVNHLVELSRGVSLGLDFLFNAKVNTRRVNAIALLLSRGGGGEEGGKAAVAAGVAPLSKYATKSGDTH